MKLTGQQLRAARAMLQWSAGTLAERSEVSLATIQRAEKKDGPVSMMPANERAIRATLEAAGIRFLPDGCVCPPKREEP
ncbi:transcriptional regulator [Teichococcus vastitatis]|uniref:Transcriptional regulator n=1 Tax=Teichococcus vastitatis TaxID=2307076 RepID=A0ABS9W4B7_9PROT|nr:transcriptional regulator [Pseudoroseomonas vastitatis]MCI0753459.1 transcriptional regulator [Pseudoroseomonas vastitatis]